MMRSSNAASGSYVSLGDAIGVDAHDDLDALRIARIRVADGRTFALVRHRHAPKPGTQIVMTTPSTDLWGDITAVLSRLQLKLDDLAWRHPAAMPRREVLGSRAPSLRSTRRNRVTTVAKSRDQRGAGRAARRSAASARAAARKK
jgi:hypothetical protein